MPLLTQPQCRKKFSPAPRVRFSGGLELAGLDASRLRILAGMSGRELDDWLAYGGVTAGLPEQLEAAMRDRAWRSRCGVGMERVTGTE